MGMRKNRVTRAKAAKAFFISNEIERLRDISYALLHIWVFVVFMVTF